MKHSPKSSHPRSDAHIWPIFISYRRGGLSNEIALWLKGELHESAITGIDGEVYRLDVFLDTAETHRANFEASLIPHLKQSRALIVIADENVQRKALGQIDYFYRELDWWASARSRTPPIILQCNKSAGAALVQDARLSKWAKASRADCYYDEWEEDSKEGTSEPKNQLIEWILGSIRDYGTVIHQAEMRKLKRRALAAALLGIIAGILAMVAWKQKVIAEEGQRRASVAAAVAIRAEQATRVRSSKADSDIALELARGGDDVRALAHVSRALELDSENALAQLLGYRLLTDGRIVVPESIIPSTSCPTTETFSKDGELLAIGYEDGNMCVRDLARKRTYRTEIGLDSNVERIAFNPQGDSVCAASRNQLVIWEFGRDSAVRVIKANFSVVSTLDLIWPTDTRIVMHNGRTWGSDYRFTQVIERTKDTWNVVYGVGDDLGIMSANLEESEEKNVHEIWHFETWVSTNPVALILHDIDNGKLCWYDLNARRLDKPFWSSVVEKDASVLVSGDSGITVIVKAGKESGPRSGIRYEWIDPRTKKNGSANADLGIAVERVSSDGKILLLRTTRGLAVTNLASGEIIVEHIYSHRGDLDLLDMSDDGKNWLLGPATVGNQSHVLLASVIGEDDVQESEISLPSRSRFLPAQFSSKIGGLGRISLTGNRIAVASSDNSIRVWGRQDISRVPISIEKDSGHNGEAVDKSRSAIAKDGIGYFYSNEVEPHLVLPPELSEEEQEGKGIGPTGFATSPDNLKIAITYGNNSSRPDNNGPGFLVIYDKRTGKALGAPAAHRDDAFSPCFSPDGSWVATAADDGRVRRFDSQSCKMIGKEISLSSGFRFLKVSPSGSLIVTGNGYLIDCKRWRVSNDLAPQIEESEQFEDAFFSSDEQILVSVSGIFNHTGAGKRGGGNYRDLSQWETSTGRRISLPLLVAEQNENTVWSYSAGSLWGDRMRWACTLNNERLALARLIRCFRQLEYDTEGNIIVGKNVDKDGLKLDNIFPEGRTALNATVYDLATRILR